MIYDYQDMSTKYYLTASVRDWVNVGENALLLLQNPRVKELTEADLSWNSDDDIVWTVMYLIGVGLLRYAVANQGKQFNLGLNLNWRKPPWLFHAESRERLNNHIDFLLQIEQEGRQAGLEPTALLPSLEIQKYGRCRTEPPKEPVNNVAHEKYIITRNRKLLARKRAFHQGRRK